MLFWATDFKIRFIFVHAWKIVQHYLRPVTSKKNFFDLHHGIPNPRVILHPGAVAENTLTEIFLFCCFIQSGPQGRRSGFESGADKSERSEHYEGFGSVSAPPPTGSRGGAPELFEFFEFWTYFDRFQWIFGTFIWLHTVVITNLIWTRGVIIVWGYLRWQYAT